MNPKYNYSIKWRHSMLMLPGHMVDPQSWKCRIQIWIQSVPITDLLPSVTSENHIILFPFFTLKKITLILSNTIVVKIWSTKCSWRDNNRGEKWKFVDAVDSVHASLWRYIYLKRTKIALHLWIWLSWTITDLLPNPNPLQVTT